MPIYDNPADANLRWEDFIKTHPWAASNGVYGNGTQEQGGRAGTSGSIVNNPQYQNYYNGNAGVNWQNYNQDVPYEGGSGMYGAGQGGGRGTQRQPTTFDYAWGRGGTTIPNTGSPRSQGDYTKPNRQVVPTPYDYSGLMAGLNALNPGDINIDSTASMFTNAALSQYGQNSADQLKYLQQAGQAGIQGYQNILGTLQGGVADYLKNINQGAQAELGGIQGTLGYYQSLANRSQLPGQNIMEQNVGANTANALNRVREFGGNSQGALGAITNLYGQQQQGMRDIGLSAAQYQAQNQANLAGYMGTVGAQRAGVYNRMGEAGLTGAGTIAQGQQMLTQAQQAAAGDISNYYGNQATYGSQFLQSLMQQRLAAEQQQADLARRSILDTASTIGSGLNAATQASDQNYYYNQVMPYTNWANYYNAMMGNQVDPNGAAAIASQMYNTNNQWAMANQAGWANAANSWGQLGGNMIGQWMFNNPGRQNYQNNTGGYYYNGNYIGE